MKLMKQVLAASVLAFVAGTSSVSLADTRTTDADQKEAVGAVLHTLSSLIRKAKIATSYDVFSAARSMQSNVRTVFIALEEDDGDVARSGIERALYGLRKIEREVRSTRNSDLLDLTKELSRKYFYARSLVLDESEEVGLTVTVLYDTYLKSSTQQAGSLSSSQKCVVDADTLLVGKDLGLVDGHIKLLLSEPVEACAVGQATTIVYIYAQHAKVN
jgi:hypothetical protein